MDKRLNEAGLRPAESEIHSESLDEKDIEYITEPRFKAVFIMLERIQVPDAFPLEWCNRPENIHAFHNYMDNNVGYILDETLPVFKDIIPRTEWEWGLEHEYKPNPSMVYTR